MRRKISLYIADSLCDLDDDALVLLNIQREDLSNPAVVRNSYSQAVTLPGTPNNNIIFDHYFRADHAVGAYNPLVRVPFAIFTEAGEVLEAGYCKLLSAKRTEGTATFEVQLYGSLGGFIYGLAYDADGNKKTLASLDYLGGGDTELDFVIDASAVSDAWARLGGDTSKPAMWDVVNFAPCYNGIPDGDFDAGKALAKPAEVGLTIPPGQQASSGGYTLLELAADLDEWEARDLRSYLQRPVLSVKALLEAIAKPGNNGGWSVDLSDIDTTTEWPYLRTWITRPLLPSLGTFKQISGDITATPSASATSGPDLVSISLADVPAGTDVTLRATFGIQVNLASAAGQTTMFTRRNNYGTEYQSVWFMQLVGYASDNSVVAASPVTIFGPSLAFVQDLAQFAADCTFAPTVPTGQTAEYIAASGFDQGSMTGSGTAFSARGSFALEAVGKNMASAKVVVKRGTILWEPLNGRVHSVTNLATLYKDTGPTATAIAESTSLATGVSVAATAQSASTLRSGARITKRMLLSTSGTPADYLLSICKTFGLYMLVDGAAKSVRIVRRNTLFVNETLDLAKRIDLSHEVAVDPIAFDAKWYDFKHEGVGGAFEKEYKENSGREYGEQRVNTGYDFDANAKDVLDGVVFKGAAAVTKFGRFMIQAPVSGGAVTPPVFILPGSKYTLWNGDGDSVENDVPQYVGAVTPLRSLGPYDFYDKAQFHDADGKPVDGSDVLLLYNGIGDALRSYPLEITDDVPDMDTINGKPCWLFGNNTTPLQLPYFSRYDINIAGWISLSLDFGIPGEMDIPNVTYFESAPIYANAWKDYIHDRLNINTKVLKCRVDLSGLQVGPELLRRFWWYGGSLWVLNKISNYSLTTFDPAECEFIQVRDMDAYLNGQY